GEGIRPDTEYFSIPRARARNSGTRTFRRWAAKRRPILRCQSCSTRLDLRLTNAVRSYVSSRTRLSLFKPPPPYEIKDLVCSSLSRRTLRLIDRNGRRYHPTPA